MRRNNHYSSRALPYLTIALLLLALTACSPNLSPSQLIFSEKISAESLRETPTFLIDIEPQSYYLIELQQQGADLQLELSMPDGSVKTHDVPLWLRGSESALIGPNLGLSSLSIVVIPFMVGNYSSAQLTVSQLASVSKDDMVRINSEQIMAKATLASESTEQPVWTARIDELNKACEQFDRLQIIHRAHQCRFNVAAITYLNLMDWKRATLLGTSLQDDIEKTADLPFRRQIDTFVIMAMIERNRDDTGAVYQLRLEQAEISLQHIVEEFKNDPSVELDMIFNVNIAGYTNNYRLRYTEANAYFQMAKELAAQTGAVRMEIYALQNQAYALKQLGNLVESARVSEGAIERLNRERGSSHLRITLHTNLAKTYSEMGRWDQSIHHYTAALSLNNQLDSDSRISLMTGLTVAYLQSGNPSRARVYMTQALSMIETETHLDAINAALQTAARLERILGHPDRALTHLDDAIAIETDALRLSHKLLLKARLLSEVGQNQDAKLSISEAIIQFNKGKEQVSEFATIRHQTMLAEWYLTSTAFQPSLARSLLDDTTDLLQRDLHPSLSRQHHYLTAYHLKSIGQLEQALKSALDLKDRIWEERFSNNSGEFVSGFIDANQRSVSLHIDVYLDQLAQLDSEGRREDFLALSQKVFQAVDAIRVNQDASYNRDTQTKKEQEELLHLEADIRRINYELTEVRQNEPHLRNRLIAELEENNRALDLIIKATGNQDGIEQGASVAHLQAALKPDHTVLTYWLGEQYSIGWLVDGDSYTAELLGSRELIEELTRKVHAYSSTPSTGGSGKRLRDLSDIIISPLFKGQATLDENEALDTEHGVLAVIPTGALSILSFGSLWLNDRRLVESHDIVYLPRLNENNRSVKTQEFEGQRSIAIYADPQYLPTIDTLETPLIASQRSSQLAPLPGTREEADRISSLFDSNSILYRAGSKANRKQFLSDPLVRFRYLHIASHAVVDPAYPSASTIMLSVYDENGLKNTDNAVLSTSDIERLRLHTDLVVLSACDTAVPLRFGLNSASGLHHSFLRAGAKAVLGSSWRVADQTTSTFMTNFYQHLTLKQRSPPASLALVQRDSITANDALYDWASWLIYVSPSTIYKPL